MSQEVSVRTSRGCTCDEDICAHQFHRAVVTRYGRTIYLDEEETKMVRDELTKALRQFKRWNTK